MIIVVIRYHFNCIFTIILLCFSIKYKKQNNAKKMPTQIVFYDEIRRGNSIEKVDVNINPKLKRVD